MPHPIALKAIPPNTLWLRYSDGVEGEVDLSPIVGRGVFAPLANAETFLRVAIAPDGALSWGGDLELCPDALYLQLTGKSPEDLFPNLKTETAHA